MAIKGQSITITYVAWDTSANATKTGDAANHSLSIIKDGGARAAAANAGAEVDATNMPGVYKLTLTAGEMTANVVRLAGKSSTANVALFFGGDIITEQGMKDLFEADLYIDTTAPGNWDLVWMLKGTGAPGAGTELMRKNVADVGGTGISNTTTVVGRLFQ